MSSDRLLQNQLQFLLKLKFPVPYLRYNKSKSLGMDLKREFPMCAEVENQFIVHAIKEIFSLNDF